MEKNKIESITCSIFIQNLFINKNNPMTLTLNISPNLGLSTSWNNNAQNSAEPKQCVELPARRIQRNQATMSKTTNEFEDQT